MIASARLVIRVDNGPEFVSRDLDLWAHTNGVILDFSRPGKPTDNAYIEGFNSRFRQECLNAYWFLSLMDARSKIEAWRVDYNTVRPHTAIGHVTPVEFAAASGQALLGLKPRRKPEFLTSGGPRMGASTRCTRTNIGAGT